MVKDWMKHETHYTIHILSNSMDNFKPKIHLEIFNHTLMSIKNSKEGKITHKGFWFFGSVSVAFLTAELSLLY